jgi:hypothetical protein
MKLYLVNGESIITEDMSDTDYLLQTFFSMKKSETELMRRFIARRGVDNFILDSGAFSLFNGIKKLTYSELKKYIDRYCDFIIKYKITQFLEMDIDAVIGYEEVKKINKYIENKVGKPPIYVYHAATRSVEDLKDKMKELDYIFWGGIAGGGKVDINTCQSFVDEAFSHSCKVHMLGYTPLNLDNVKNLYSCDSSSWTMGGRVGTVYQFTNDKMETYKFKDKKRITFFQLNDHNFNQWLKYQEYLKNKGWITT